MLNKLIKYEIKSVARYFVPLYGLILSISLMLGLTSGRFFTEYTGQMGGTIFFATLTAILVSVYIALTVVTIIMIVTRFNRNLLGDEGYLMMTLPVKVEEVIHSKWISAMLWMILSTIVAILGFTFLFIRQLSTETFMLIFERLGDILSEVDNFAVLLVVANVFLAFLHSIFTIYFSLSLAHLSPFNKHRNIWAVVIYVMIGNVVAIVSNKVLELLNPGFIEDEFYGSIEFWNSFNRFLGTSLLLQIVLACIFFYSTHHILSKKLNLE